MHLAEGPNISPLFIEYVSSRIYYPCYISLCGLFQVSNLIMVKPTKGLQPYQEFILQACHIVLLTEYPVFPLC